MKKTSKFIILTALVGCSCLFAECPLGCTCSKCQAKQEEQSCPKDCSCPKCQAKQKEEGCSRGCSCPKYQDTQYFPYTTKPRSQFTGDHPSDCTCAKCEVERQDEQSSCSPAEKASVQGPLKETYPKIALA